MSEIAGLFRRITLGVYVIGVSDAGRHNAFTAAWVTQTSYRPLVLAVAVNPANASYAQLKAAGAFTVNVLKSGQLELAHRFGTPRPGGASKLDGIAWHPGARGAPILDEAAAWFECEIAGTLPAGDHEIVVGRVLDGRILDANAQPMNYAETGDLDGSGALYPPTF